MLNCQHGLLMISNEKILYLFIVFCNVGTHISFWSTRLACWFMCSTKMGWERSFPNKKKIIVCLGDHCRIQSRGFAKTSSTRCFIWRACYIVGKNEPTWTGIIFVCPQGISSINHLFTVKGRFRDDFIFWYPEGTSVHCFILNVQYKSLF